MYIFLSNHKTHAAEAFHRLPLLCGKDGGAPIGHPYQVSTLNRNDSSRTDYKRFHRINLQAKLDKFYQFDNGGSFIGRIMLNSFLINKIKMHCKS